MPPPLRLYVGYLIIDNGKRYATLELWIRMH